MVTQHVTVSGRNMEVGMPLTEHVRTQMMLLSEKYFGRIVSSRVVFTKAAKGHSFSCNIQVSIGTDLHYAGSAEFDDVYRCFNIAYEHIAKQMRRKKRALHEDKPNGHLKELTLNELSQQEPPPDDLLLIDGEDLSITDVAPDACNQAVKKLYGGAT